MQESVNDKGPLKLASCLVVQDCNGATFLTQRSSTMRVFPHGWVLPGGHIEIGESLEEGAVREMFEETGIALERDQDGILCYLGERVDIKPFFAFESSIIRMISD